uniref:Protein kinase domain-containing protein n=1 Tax=Panagrolaimus sp. PS1159 TaxID=55785 RepID=A0AC35G175_9BILA
TEAIEELHKVGFVHRDIKPSNFAIGRKSNQQRTIYIYDFGLCRSFIVSTDGGKTKKLRDPRKNVPFKGTVRYCSLNVHRFEEYGRHDDLWSMLYMIVEMYAGSLPWKGMDRRKAEITKESCDEEFRKSMPKEFLPLVKHLRKLNYLKTPDYVLIKDSLTAACTLAKEKDERREAENDQNTRCDVEDIDDNDYGYDDVASHVSGVSAADDTLQKLDDLK